MGELPWWSGHGRANPDGMGVGELASVAWVQEIWWADQLSYLSDPSLWFPHPNLCPIYGLLELMKGSVPWIHSHRIFMTEGISMRIQY